VQAVLAPSEAMPEDAETVCGWDFERGRDLDGLLDSLLRTGFQATSFGRAVNEVNRMVCLTHAPPPPSGHRGSSSRSVQSHACMPVNRQDPHS
jgi:hypothetical protein